MTHIPVLRIPKCNFRVPSLAGHSDRHLYGVNFNLQIVGIHWIDSMRQF